MTATIIPFPTRMCVRGSFGYYMQQLKELIPNRTDDELAHAAHLMLLFNEGVKGLEQRPN